MKWLWWFGIVFLAVFAVLAVADEASASTDCHATGNWCQGHAVVSTTTGGVASSRCMQLKMSTTASTCTINGILGQNLGGWTFAAGSCGTIYYYDTTSGAAPPAAPNVVTIAVRFDNTATNIITFVNAAAEPASGTSYSFCATDTGLAGGSPRAGTYRIYGHFIKNNGPGGVGNYDIDTDGVATVGSIIESDQGAIRSNIIVSSLIHGGYPAGSTYAYGTAANELISVTATFTQPNGDNNREPLRLGVVDEATLAIGEAGATVDIDATTTLSQDFTVDTTFPATGNPYVAFIETGTPNAALTNLRWTVLAASGHCGTCVRLSDVTLYDSSDIAIDPAISFDQDGTGTPDNLATVRLTNCSGSVVTLENRGETGCGAWYLLNARGEQLARAMTFTTEDASAVACTSHGSLTPTSGKYSVTWAIPTAGICAVANDLTGSARYMRASNTDQVEVSNDFLHVSSLYLVTPWTDLDGTRGAAPDLVFNIRDDGAGGDDSDTIHHACRVRGVRDDVDIDTSGSAVTQTLKDPTTATRASRTTDTDSTGWTPTDQTLLATTPLGDDWTAPCSVAFNGNTGTSTLTFEVGIEGGGGGETVYTGADPLTVFGGEWVFNQTIPVAIHSRMLDGEARVGAEAAIFASVFTWPAMVPIATAEAVVEVDAVNAPGAYVYAFEPPSFGSFLIAANTTDGVTPIGAHNVITLTAAGNYSANLTELLAQLQDHRASTIEVLMTSDFYGVGFDGFCFFLFWFGCLLLFFFLKMKWLMATSVLGIVLVVFPNFGFKFETNIILFLLGVAFQYLKDEELKEREAAGVDTKTEN